MTFLVGRQIHSRMLPFERASQKTWLGHIFIRNWRPNQKCTFWSGLPYPPQVQFYDFLSHGRHKTYPNKVFLHTDFIFNVFILLRGRQSPILTPIGTGKQSDAFGRSSNSFKNVAIRKSVQKNLAGTHFY